MIDQIKIRTALLLLLMVIPLPNLRAQQIIVNAVRFEGGEAFGETRLANWCPVKAGMVWDPVLTEQANHSLIGRMRSDGYLLARIDSVATRISEDSAGIGLTWYITEDLPFEISGITVNSDSIAVERIREVMDLREGDRYDRIRIEADLAEISRLCARNGYPFAEIDVAEPLFVRREDRYDTKIVLDVRCGRQVRLDFIRIDGNEVTRDEVVLRELDLKTGDIYRQDQIEGITEKLNRLGFFKEVEQPRLLVTGRGKRGLLIKLQEGNTTTFDGVVGYVPPAKAQGVDEGYFTGLINLNFRNLFGTGRRFQVDWKKPDRISDEFRLYYEEPWIFGFPLNIGVGLHRLVRDTTYIERSYLLNGMLRLTSNFRVNFALNHNSYSPDSLASREQRLARNRIVSGEAGLIYDTRDYPPNPRRGLYYDTFYSFGFKENLGPDYLFDEDGLAAREDIQKLRLTLEYIQALWGAQVFYLKLAGAQVKSSEDRLQLTDHYWFGGARTVRGYREDQFHGTTISFLNLEYRFLAGRDTRIFVFNDWGFYNYREEDDIKEDIVSGFGIGLRFNTPLGIMGVDFGMGRGDSFSTGKIHVGVVNNF